MRTIRFRGQDLMTLEWRYGYLYQINLEGRLAAMILTTDNLHSNNSIAPRYHLAFTLGVDLFLVKPETVGQFTGLEDKNGREIYEGDIVEFYTLDTYCINPDCEPHLIGYNYRICKKSGEIEFEDGVFGIERDSGFTELLHCGFYKHEIKDLKEMEKDAYFDTNGYEINNSIVGVEVIGNIHEEGEL